jgi:hypothetical protein
MTILIENGAIHLKGVCGHDEVEVLLEAIAENAQLPIDLTQTEHLHTAILQILLRSELTVQGGAGDDFIREWVLPALQ